MKDHPITILLARALPEDILEQVQALSSRLEFISEQAVKDDPVLLAQVEIIYGYIDRTWWERAGRLRWVQVTWAGVERLLTPEAKAHPAVITNAHIHGEPIAEHLFGMLLMLVRRLHAACRQQLEHHWGSVGQPDILAGMTLGVVGTGAIGTRAGELGKAFGMRVWGMRRSGAPQPPFERIFTPAQKAEMFPHCDVLMVTLPLAPDTMRFIGPEELRLIKHGAYLFNIGRGKVIDTAALVQALQDGTLGGAGLDVFDPEPLPPDHPLWDLPNVIISPHYAGGFPGYNAAAARLFLDNLRRYLAGEQLEGVVDKEAGY